MRLPKSVATIVAIIAGAALVIQQYAITMSAGAHSVVAFALFVLAGLGIAPLTAEQLGKLIPVHVAAALTVGAGILQAFQQLALNIPSFWHSVISVVLLIAAALGIKPQTAPARSG